MKEKKNKGGLTQLTHWMNYQLCGREVVLQLCAGNSPFAVTVRVIVCLNGLAQKITGAAKHATEPKCPV